jgi:hypothetical protein
MDFAGIAWNAFVGVLSGIGGGAALWKLATDTWLEKRKTEWNKQLETLKDSLSAEQRRLQAQLDSAVFVTRSHFEIELNAMKEVHLRLAELKIFFHPLSPANRNDRPDGSRKEEYLRGLSKATADYWVKLQEWGAFLEPSLYDSFERSYYGAEAECERISKGIPSDEDRIRNQRQFSDNYRAACQGIRDRVKSLSILPRSL